MAIDGQKVGSGGVLTRTVALKRRARTPRWTSSATASGRAEGELGTRPDLEGRAVRPRQPRTRAEQSSKARVGVSLSNLDPRMAERTALQPRRAR